MNRVKIVTFVPPDYADKMRSALGEAGAGIIGEYSYCSSSSKSTGRSMPSINAKPFIGKANTIEIIDEERIEVVCDRTKAKTVIDAMKSVHPYDEVAFDVYQLIEEDDL